MSKIGIPPAALEAGARALAIDAKLNWGDIPQTHNILRREARAAFVAMLEAWPNGGLHVPVGVGEPRKSFTLPALILPLMENPDDQA